MRNTNRVNIPLALLLSGTTALSACGGKDDAQGIDGSVVAQSQFLTRAQSCDHLSTLIQDDLIAKLDHLINHRDEFFGEPGRGGVGSADESTSTDDSAEAPMDSSGGDAQSGGGQQDSGGGEAESGTAGEGPSDHSGTNNQVQGVDEADILKTSEDGTRLWLLHKNTLATLATWPPQSLGLESSLVIEGVPIELFVENDVAVVFSRIYREEFSTYNYGNLDHGDDMGSSTPGSPGMPEPAPTPTDEAESGQSEPGSAGDSDSGGSEDMPEPDPDTDPDAPPDVDVDEEGGEDSPDWEEGDDLQEEYGREYWDPNGIQITVVHLAGETPEVAETFQVPGQYISARRHENTVRLVVNSELIEPGFREPPDLWEASEAEIGAWRDSMVALITDTSVGDWLMPRFAGSGENSTELDVNCADYYAPKAGSTGFGLTSVISFDVSAPTLGGANILGDGSTVYSSKDRLVVTHSEFWNGYWGDDTNSTVLHAFSVSASPTTGYVGSGRVPGTINNQFSIDADGSTLRVATTVRDLESWAPDNELFVLGESDGELEIIGRTGSIMKEETIRSVRYVGDMAYVVTFMETDPLFAIDVSDATAPTIRGELKIPGFSTYMHPLGDDQLLTIGRDREEDGWSGDALALQIFDVSDVLSPKLAHKFVASASGSSAAEHEHKAFTFYPRASGNLLAIPFESWGGWGGAGGDRTDGPVGVPEEDPATSTDSAEAMDGGYYSSVELFSIDGKLGITPSGSVSHSEYMGERCGDYHCYDAFMRRGVFIDDYLYSISLGAVTVHDSKDLETLVAVLPLP